MSGYNHKPFRKYIAGKTPVYASDMMQLDARLKRLESLKVSDGLTLTNYSSNPVLGLSPFTILKYYFVELDNELKPRSYASGHLLRPQNIDTDKLTTSAFVRVVDYLGFHYFDWDRLFVVESPYEENTFIPVSSRAGCKFELRNTVGPRESLSETAVDANPLLWSRKAQKYVTGPLTTVYLPFDWHIDVKQAIATCQYEISSSRWIINAADCDVGRELGSFTSSGL